ncbi:MAG: pseudoazurin, partial [Pseudomonadota bacterium]
MLTRRSAIVSLGALAAASTGWACPLPGPSSGVHPVLMLNAACGDTNNINGFESGILRVAQGDSVQFLPTDQGHNTASKRGMIPDGAEPWNGGIDEALTVTF